MSKLLLGFTSLIVTAGTAGCMGGGSNGSNNAQDIQTWQPQVANSAYKTDALIYDGDYAAFGDADAIANILESHGRTYQRVNSSDLAKMSIDDLDDSGLIVWPGGYAGKMSNTMSTQSRANLKRAVNERGIGFVGFCAGAFIAVSPDTSWGFALKEAETLPYYHLEDEGIPIAMTPVQFADGSERDLVWWGGPYTPEYPGGVIARYKDTLQPAISQSWAGNGLMVIAGPHPEAPESWRADHGLSDSDGLDQDIAWQMMDAALHQKPMESF
jgi:hypothetical protein